MKHYIALIEKDDHSRFCVSFPQFKTVSSYGDTFEEAVRNAEKTLRLFFENNFSDCPAPLTMGQVRNLRKIQNNLATGAVLVALPYIELTGRTVRANLTLDAGLLSAVDNEARARGISRSSFFASAAADMLNN